jgi:site-specific recombinase XerD
MIKQFFPDSATRERLLCGPLGGHIENFAAILASRGYARSTVREKLRALGHFNRWLHRRGLSVAALDESLIEKFRRYRRRHGRVDCATAPTLKALLAYLRERGQAPAPEPVADDNLPHRLEGDYAQYLAQQRGLASATLINYLPVARRFLLQRFGASEWSLGELCARDIHRFVLQQSRRVSRRRAQLIVTALRSFLRYLHQRGHIGADLAATVPTVASWRLTELPKALPPEQVERLLASCDRRTPGGQRDYAMLLLLARLGLRAGEVVALTLDDIDWEAAVVNVRGKGARHEPLPLPQDVGEALVGYLRHGRPCCDTRRVFVRLHAPRGGFASSCAIDDVLERAFARAGLEPAFKGAHVLRHALATRLLQHGASLAEIAELLRHRRLETTQIYAKVDLAALRALAQPWPGGAR